MDFFLYLRILIARFRAATLPEALKSAAAAAPTPEKGYLAGDICGRDGCAGIIAEGDREHGCSCQFGAAPCSSCTTPREYCQECDWSAKDEEWG